jgi:hypothetical protein
MQNEEDLSFAIPTNRLRDLGETVEQYGEHFWRNGHLPQIIVFDDSTPTNQEKYFPLLEKTKTHHDLYYGGPREEEQFVAYLNGRLRDKRLPGGVQSRIARRRRGAPGTASQECRERLHAQIVRYNNGFPRCVG